MQQAKEASHYDGAQRKMFVGGPWSRSRLVDPVLRRIIDLEIAPFLLSKVGVLRSVN